MCKTWIRLRMWIGIILMPTRIRIGIKMEIWIRIRIGIGIKTMPINNTEFYNIKENATLRKKEMFSKQYTLINDVFT
jgi:hypothetical protein